MPPLRPSLCKAGCANPSHQHAFIEFDEEISAIKASEAVYEADDWWVYGGGIEAIGGGRWIKAHNLRDRKKPKNGIHTASTL